MSVDGPARSSGWHADDGLLARYVRGDSGALHGASVEQHLTRCPDCRARIARHVPAPPLEAVWERIREQAHAPARGPVERLLLRLGVREPDALLVAAAPSLRTSWLFGLAATLIFVGLAAGYGGTRGLAFFLLFAPLVPVAGVAFAYGPDADPSYELAAAAPYPAARLLLLRAAAVLVTSLPLVLAAAVLVPALSWTAVSWLVPALALTATTLAVSTWVRPTIAATGLGVLWIAVVADATVDLNPAAVLSPALLVAYAGLGLVATLVLRVRLRRISPPSSFS
jgi:hypothetical protein